MIDQIIDQANNYYQENLGIIPRRTNLNIVNPNNWNSFCGRYLLNTNSDGLFLPRNLTAYIKDNENKSLSLFHEYFGHGLFYEYSKQGRFVTKLEKRLEKEEKIEFNKGKFSIEELKEFRKNNPIFNLLLKQKKENLFLYEIFAIYTEYLLSDKLGFTDNFNEKYKDIDKSVRDELDKIIKFKETYGEIALFYEMGMPKYYNKEKLNNLLENLFKDRINEARFILSYGSKKPYSDIDLFVVSDLNMNFTNNWIDIYSLNPKDFEYKVKMFDVSVTNALSTGELIYGNLEYFEYMRNRIKEQQITKEAIYYNLIKGKEQQILAQEYPDNSRERLVGEKYFKTYLGNARNLALGKKISTKQELLY